MFNISDLILPWKQFAWWDNNFVIGLFQTYLQTTFGAVVHQNTDVWSVYARADERADVVVTHVPHLQKKVCKWNKSFQTFDDSFQKTALIS